MLPSAPPINFRNTGIIPIDWNGSLHQSELLPSGGNRRVIQESVVARTQTTTQDEGRMTMIDVTGVKVFSATKAKERELLGELITDWIRSHPEHEIVDKIVTQSSDSEFHCLTITLFYKHASKA
jgi:hypothetical protein